MNPSTHFHRRLVRGRFRASEIVSSGANFRYQIWVFERCGVSAIGDLFSAPNGLNLSVQMSSLALYVRRIRAGGSFKNAPSPLRWCISVVGQSGDALRRKGCRALSAYPPVLQVALTRLSSHAPPAILDGRQSIQRAVCGRRRRMPAERAWFGRRRGRARKRQESAGNGRQREETELTAH